MSDILDGILSLAICCIGCIGCIEFRDSTNSENKDEYHEINGDNDKNKNNKLYRLSCEYQLSDDRLIRNRDGNAMCGWCNDTITDNTTTLVQCVSCEKLMGHPICFKQNKICPYCISLI